jgi:hypothetical protein
MSISSGGAGVKGQAETQEGRTFEGAAFSKTLLKLADQRCRRTRRNPSSLERRRRQARRLVRFNIMAQGHTARGLGMSSSQNPATPPARSIFAVTISPTFCGRRLVR